MLIILQLFLPFSYVRNNFPRIQTAISDIRGLLDNLSSVNQAATVIEQGLIDACKQFSRQLQSRQVSIYSIRKTIPDFFRKKLLVVYKCHEYRGTVKFLNFRMPEIFAVIYLKFKEP